MSPAMLRELADLFLVESDRSFDDSERLARISMDLYDKADEVEEAEESECAA